MQKKEHSHFIQERAFFSKFIFYHTVFKFSKESRHVNGNFLTHVKNNYLPIIVVLYLDYYELVSFEEKTLPVK
jgi:hypothetical protein